MVSAAVVRGIPEFRRREVGGELGEDAHGALEGIPRKSEGGGSDDDAPQLDGIQGFYFIYIIFVLLFLIYIFINKSVFSLIVFFIDVIKVFISSLY